MNSNAGYQIRFDETWYEIKVVDSASGKEVAKLIDDIGKISYSNYKSKVDTVQTARNGYDALTAEAKKEVKNYSTLQEAEKSLSFYQQIDDAKAKLAALPKLTNPTQAQANAYRSQINEATAAYKKLSAEQQKYITKADVENYNALAKALGVSTIVGADAAPESPVETTGKTGSATTTSPTEVKVSGTTAAATVKAENQSEILKQAAEKKSAEIILEVSKADSKGADSVQLSLDVTFVKNVADKTNADLTVNTENGKVTLDQETLKAIIGEAKGNTVTIEITKVTKPTEAQKKAAGANGDIFSLVVKSGDKIISEFNKGKATVRVEIPAKLADKKVAAIHIADDAKNEQLAGKVLTIGGKKYYEFTTPHFSTFALVDAEELGLEVNPKAMMLGVVSRLTDQKGFDLIAYMMDELCQDAIQLVVLGTGEEKYENMFRHFAWKYDKKVSANIYYSEAMSHKIYAAADAFLMPSLFEPCGLSQLMSLRYGTVPIVRETGGLKDTVQPYNEFEGTGTGFSFTNYNAHEMLNTIRYAERVYYDRKREWNKIVDRGMAQDYSWNNSAKQYEEMYTWLAGY